MYPVLQRKGSWHSYYRMHSTMTLASSCAKYRDTVIIVCKVSWYYNIVSYWLTSRGCFTTRILRCLIESRYIELHYREEELHTMTHTSGQEVDIISEGRNFGASFSKGELLGYKTCTVWSILTPHSSLELGLSTQQAGGGGGERKRKSYHRTLCVVLIQLPMQVGLLYSLLIHMLGWLFLPEPCKGEGCIEHRQASTGHRPSTVHIKWFKRVEIVLQRLDAGMCTVLMLEWVNMVMLQSNGYVCNHWQWKCSEM